MRKERKERKERNKGMPARVCACVAHNALGLSFFSSPYFLSFPSFFSFLYFSSFLSFLFICRQR